jgi:hypothetical protein
LIIAADGLCVARPTLERKMSHFQLGILHTVSC